MQVAILLYPGLTALDAIGPYEVLHGLDGVEVRFVWKEVGPIVADSRVLVIGATHTLAETMRPDVVLVPGSSGDTAVIMADKEVLAWLRDVHLTTSHTVSVCSGALILAAAGLLRGRCATTHWFGMDGLRLLGATPRPKERVVRDGKVWTAAGVSAGIDLALELAAELCGEHAARVAQLWIEYDPHPPFNSGHIDLASDAVARDARKFAQREAVNARSALAIPSILLHRVRQAMTNLRREDESG